jgi:hypothetical protein
MVMNFKIKVKHLCVYLEEIRRLYRVCEQTAVFQTLVIHLVIKYNICCRQIKLSETVV